MQIGAFQNRDMKKIGVLARRLNDCFVQPQFIRKARRLLWVNRFLSAAGCQKRRPYGSHLIEWPSSEASTERTD